ncbi:hypothetical protein LCGC14_0477980 [marine sediment metagenome]|uniref:Methyltransferase type 11 domain-containing protein n=1 Tax=marine sediment metagenome TaxID=412755 RepID=A0A0F9STD7_9ZZZZ
MKDKFILDACCGGRAFWFNKKHPNTIYQDIRIAKKGHVKLRPNHNVTPDVLGDFRKMKFKDKSFKLIVWDPPHFTQGGETGWQVQKYGKLNKETWREDLRKGFNEIWRVLDDYGVLVFKWNEYSIHIKEVLSCFDVQPLFGHPTAKAGKTKWFTFMKIPK